MRAERAPAKGSLAKRRSDSGWTGPMPASPRYVDHAEAVDRHVDALVGCSPAKEWAVDQRPGDAAPRSPGAALRWCCHSIDTARVVDRADTCGCSPRIPHASYQLPSTSRRRSCGISFWLAEIETGKDTHSQWKDRRVKVPCCSLWKAHSPRSPTIPWLLIQRWSLRCLRQSLSTPGRSGMPAGFFPIRSRFEPGVAVSHQAGEQHLDLR
jgi:hypothetical protein